jgi:hypothetical protein
MLLYKYMPPERRQFLEKLLIRFTPPGLFNDPFDCLPFIDGFDASTISPTGNPPALPEDSRSLTAPGVVCEAVFREPLKVYERDRPCKRMRV